MNRTRTKSIRQKLLNWLLILVLPSLLLGSVSAYYTASYFSNLVYDRALFRVALAVAEQVDVKNGEVKIDLPESTLKLIEFDIDDWIYYQIQDANHHVIFGYINLSPPAVMPKANQAVYYETNFKQKALHMVAFNLPLTELGANGNVTILIGENTLKRDKMANEIVAIMLVPQILLILLIIFAINLGIKRGLISLENLKQLILKRQPGDINALEEQDAPEELQPLLHAMNELLAKEKIAIDKRRNFLANAAHQLKTPLAGLKVQAEAALREKDFSHVQHALKQISNGSENLARLANQLLSLARAEPESGMNQEFEQLDLVMLVHKVSMDWVPKALDKNIDLGVKCQLKNLIINGNPLLLQELLNNLIDNAIRYNQAGANVTVGLALHDGEAALSVKDNGVGIAINDQEKVFDRFYRVLGSHENGCGLGLAIVREIANQHQASVALTYSDIKHGRGTLVTIKFKLTIEQAGLGR
jgi:two-component system sensor histidine kinase TctE